MTTKKPAASRPLFFARFERDGMVILVHELEDGTYTVSRRDGPLPPSVSERERACETRDEAFAEALGCIDDYT